MKKVRFLMSLVLVLILSMGFDNTKNVSAAGFPLMDEFSVVEQRSVEQYGEEFMDKQTAAYGNYERLMKSFEKNSLRTLAVSAVTKENSSSTDTDGTVVSDDMVYPDYYAGSYTDTDGNFVVYTTEEEDSISPRKKQIAHENVLEEVEGALDNDNFILKEAEYSYNELNDVMDKLNEYKLSRDNAISNNFNTYWLSDEDNCVYVELDDYSIGSIKEFKENVCSSNSIKFLHSMDEFEKEKNINAGREISCNGAGGSVGYRAKRDGKTGFITAGHMGSKGNAIKIGGTTVGKITARKESGSVDAAFVQVTNSDYTPVNILNGTSNKLSTTISEPGVGTVINKLGMKTGATTGKVISKNATITLDGITHTNLTSASYSSDHGDSGGTVYSYISSTNTRLTLGIHCGRKDGKAYYIKANQINKALGTSRY